MVPSDKLPGRPIRLNRQELKPNKEHYAEVMLVGDVHYGSPQCDVLRFRKMLDYCLEYKLHVLLMGDMIEMATRESVGSGVYEQEFIGQSQYEGMVEFLRPLAEAKLFIGLLEGNHEERVYNMTGINVTKAMCRELSIPYLGHACWNLLTINGQRYTLYSLHGRTAAIYDGTVLTALERIATSFDADVVAMGHAHKAVFGYRVTESVVGSRVVQKKKHIVVTGSYLKYDGSYYQKKGGQISKLGSPKLKLFANAHDVFISW